MSDRLRSWVRVCVMSYTSTQQASTQSRNKDGTLHCSKALQQLIGEPLFLIPGSKKTHCMCLLMGPDMWSQMVPMTFQWREPKRHPICVSHCSNSNMSGCQRSQMGSQNGTQFCGMRGTMYQWLGRGRPFPFFWKYSHATCCNSSCFHTCIQSSVRMCGNDGLHLVASQCSSSSPLGSQRVVSRLAV